MILICDFSLQSSVAKKLSESRSWHNILQYLLKYILYLIGFQFILTFLLDLIFNNSLKYHFLTTYLTCIDCLNDFFILMVLHLCLAVEEVRVGLRWSAGWAVKSMGHNPIHMSKCPWARAPKPYVDSLQPSVCQCIFSINLYCPLFVPIINYFSIKCKKKPVKDTHSDFIEAQPTVQIVFFSPTI